jgi:hypothetical protein
MGDVFVHEIVWEWTISFYYRLKTFGNGRTSDECRISLQEIGWIFVESMKASIRSRSVVTSAWDPTAVVKTLRWRVQIYPYSMHRSWPFSLKNISLSPYNASSVPSLFHRDPALSVLPCSFLVHCVVVLVPWFGVVVSSSCGSVCFSCKSLWR